MSSLRDALLKANLVTGQRVREADFEDELEREARTAAQVERIMTKHTGTLQDLAEVKTIREFRDRARKLLVERPDAIDTVIRLAHGFTGEPGGKRLVWQVFSVRDRLRHVPGPERDRFLRRAFRAHGATMDVPEIPADAGDDNP